MSKPKRVYTVDFLSHHGCIDSYHPYRTLKEAKENISNLIGYEEPDIEGAVYGIRHSYKSVTLKELRHGYALVRTTETESGHPAIILQVSEDQSMIDDMWDEETGEWADL